MVVFFMDSAKIVDLDFGLIHKKVGWRKKTNSKWSESIKVWADNILKKNSFKSFLCKEKMPIASHCSLSF